LRVTREDAKNEAPGWAVEQITLHLSTIGCLSGTIRHQYIFLEGLILHNLAVLASFGLKKIDGQEV
jgi:hypothetical protein